LFKVVLNKLEQYFLKQDGEHTTREFNARVV